MSIDRCAYTNAKNNSREKKTFGENLGTAWRCHPNISTNGMCFHDECELRKTIYRAQCCHETYTTAHKRVKSYS